ncbi:unnamed protein product [Rhodiola kirilowii]
MNRVLTEEVSKEEIRKPVFQIGSTKAPGPDGFSVVFFQRCWETVKHDLIREVWNYFTSLG